MIAVLMLGLLWTASARLTEEQSICRADTPVRAGSPRDTDIPARASTSTFAPTRLSARRGGSEKTVQATIRIPAQATVNAPRFRLGDIATIETEGAALREQLSQIELGASPLAGQTRAFTKQQLLMRLRQHKIELSTVQIEMPDTVRLSRAAQTLDTTQLEQFAREQLKAAVGDSASEWTLESPPSSASIPSGAVEFRLEGAPRVASGSATMEITALVDGQPRAKYLLRFKAPQKARQIAVRSGEQVQVRVLSGGVVLEVRGVARATGAIDEMIPVYIPDTQKTLRAQIVESGVVEVRL